MEYLNCENNPLSAKNLENLTSEQFSKLVNGIKNKKIKNLFYAGQLTVPGPGVPPALISGKIAATQLIKHLNIPKHEAII